MELFKIVHQATSDTLQVVNSLDEGDYTVHRLETQTQIMEASLETFQKYIHSTISALKRKQNSLQPISRLPPETLATIVWESLPHSGPLEVYRRLARLSLVCIDWHGAIEDNPRFWSSLRHGLPELLFRKILSKSALLDVTLGWLGEELPFEEEWLGCHGRWKSLRLSCATTVTNRLVAVAAPLALETVFIRGTEQIAHFAAAPALRELHIHGVVTDWGTFPYTTLQVLELDYGSNLDPNVQHVPLLQLFAILRQNSALRVLRLNSALPTIDGLDEASPIPRVDLPHLERLELNLPSRQALLLLSSINCPRGVLPQLNLTWRDAEDLDALTVEAAAAVVQLAAPDIHTAAMLKLDFVVQAAMLICQQPDGLIGFKLTLSSFPAEHALLFVRLFVKSLSPHIIPISLSITSWRTEFDNDDVFGAMAELPEVRKLRINDSGGNVCPFTRRLSKPLSSGKEEPVRWPFPRMSSFFYERGNCNVKHILQMLQARYAAGKPEGEAEAGTSRNGESVPLPLESFRITRKMADDDGESRLLLETLIGNERIRYL